MAEGFKRIPSVIGAHTALTDSAERQVLDRKMKKTVIHTHPTRTCAGEELSSDFRILTERIESQRFGPIVDEANGFAEGFGFQNG